MTGVPFHVPLASLRAIHFARSMTLELPPPAAASGSASRLYFWYHLPSMRTCMDARSAWATKSEYRKLVADILSGLKSTVSAAVAQSFPAAAAADTAAAVRPKMVYA